MAYVYGIFGRWCFLFLALLLGVLLSPLFDTFDDSLEKLFFWLMNFVILSTVFFGIPSKYDQWLIVLVSLFFLFGFFNSGVDEAVYYVITLFLLYVYLVAKLFSYLIRVRSVGFDEIFGYLCTYLLIGVAFSFLYILFLYIDPHAFVFAKPVKHYPFAMWPELLYYSFITITTVGFGDITPYSGLARSATVLEGLLGVMYNVVVISLSVGIFLKKSR